MLNLKDGISQSREQLKEEIDKVIYFETEINYDNIPGFTIGVILKDSTFVYNFGKPSKNKTNELTSAAHFEIGSVTKVFTSSLISVLADEGLMSFDDPFNSYLPANFQNNRLKEMTIRDLVQHTAGFPRMPVDFGTHEKELNNPYAYYSKEALMEFYKKFRPIPLGKKDSEYNYSNVNYALLEIAIENATGKSYSEVLKEKILEPSEMLNTFSPSHLGMDSLLIQGYSRTGSEAMPWKFQSFTASQGLRSNVDDLLTFLKMQMDLKKTPYDSLFNLNTTRAINTGHSKNAFMGNGWHIIQLKKYYDVILHSGSTAGHRAFIGFVKETQTGVVILSNSEHATSGLGYLILRLINFNWKK